MKRPLVALSFLLLLPAVSIAQAAKLTLPNFDKLEGKAKESVNITLDGDLLQTAGRFAGGAMAGSDPEAAEVLKGLKGIYIRSFTFDKPNVYSQDDVESVRKQINGPGWSKLVSVHSSEKGEHVDIFMRTDTKEGGLVILASEPKELTIVNIVGMVDLEKLRKLQGKFGVPKMGGEDAAEEK